MKKNQTGVRKRTDAERVLLSSLGAALFGGVPCEAPKEIMDAAFALGKVHAVAATAFADVPADRFSDAAAVPRHLFTVMKNNAAVHAGHRDIDRLLTGAGIPYCILKGAASASYYPVPSLRAMGDVDFLVHEEDVARAAERLSTAGYVPTGMPHGFHDVYHKGDLSYELHRAVTEFPDTPVGRRVREMLSDTVDTARLTENALCTCRLPDDFHHGLIMLLHMQHHMFAVGIGLRHLSDFAVFLFRLGEERFRATLEAPLREVGLWHFAAAVSAAAHVGLGLPYMSFMAEGMPVAEALLCDILDSGNFGRADDGRLGEGYFLAAVGGDVKNGPVRNLFLSVNGATVHAFPFLRRWWILRPPFWVFIVLRRVVRVLTGKRKPAHLVSAYRRGRPRRELYRALAAFEPEGEHPEERTKPL